MLDGKKALWGGYSLVDAELRGMKRLLQMGKWSHFIADSETKFGAEKRPRPARPF
jgi:hypothetical protein